jgi:putative hydrolase of the HAD superfamily
MSVSCLWFDLDNTVYPRSSRFLDVIDRRINLFISERYGYPLDEAAKIRRTLYEKHGATLLGLYVKFGTDYDDYIDFVYDVRPQDYLAYDPELSKILNGLPQKKLIFSNSNLPHIRRVLDFLGITNCFDGFFYLEKDLIVKPDRRAFDKVVTRTGCTYRDSLLIDDVERNLAAGRALGMQTLKIDETLAATEYDCIRNVRDIGYFLSKGTTA